MDVSFPGSLSVITGETGAGKSIFLEALGLVLGKRAEAGVLKNKSKKCIVEAEFDARNLDLRSFFEEHEIDEDSNLILRREISVDGKSRSFLNDSVVGLNALKSLSELLVDVHSQHQTLLLNQSNFQLDLLDSFAGSKDLFKQYKKEFAELLQNKNNLTSLLEQEAQGRKELDYFQFLFNELQETEIKTGLLQSLEDESLSLENAETIQNVLLSSSNAISGGDTNILQGLAQIKQSLQSIVKYGQAYASLHERLNGVYIELKDLSAELEDKGSETQVDNARLEQVNSQMDKLNRLLKKHNVQNEEDLLRIKEEVEQKLTRFGSMETEIKKTQEAIVKKTKLCRGLAEDMSKKRREALASIEKQVKETLQDLSMENATFKIELSKQEEIGPAGFDVVKFLFSANKGTVLSELQKVASGGELSRLMLTLKALLASKKELPTIIFDEIDTGVSGDVADKIGNILIKMGQKMQVVTITHLPQIASKGKHHLFVYKKDEEDQTSSYIRQLNKDERVLEIAKMLSTGNPSQSALKNAKELLELN